MKRMIQGVAIAAAISVSGLMASTAPAQAYQVDCAILLCLAGGWPASAPCAHARTVFIQRVTPWPIEPPLQIWRCPMRTSLNAPAQPSPMERLYAIAFRDPPLIHWEAAPQPVARIQADEQADIDISGDAFAFVRSIRVYHIQVSQRENSHGDCTFSDSTRLGTYGVRGDFRWTSVSVDQVPPASAFRYPRHCDRVSYQAVFVDWLDYEGNYGFEEIRY